MLFALFVVTTLLLAGTFVFSKAEGWSYTDSFYFSVMTLTTVGYGDFVPTQNPTKIFTSFYSMIGIAAMVYLFGSVIGEYLFKQEENLERIFSKLRTIHKKVEEPIKIKKNGKTMVLGKSK